MFARVHTSRQRGIALIITLMLVVLLVSVTARLATMSAVEAIRTNRSGNNMQHRLGAESMLSYVAEQMHVDPLLAYQYERTGEASLELNLGDCRVRCQVVNDGAKFNVNTFGSEGEQNKLARKLRKLAQRLDLPRATVSLRPTEQDRTQKKVLSGYLWYDQLFKESDGTSCFSVGDYLPSESTIHAHLVWSDVVTIYGNGRVDVRHARPEVLRTLLEDIDKGAAEEIASRRSRKDSSQCLDDILAEASEETRSEIQQRITANCERKAITLSTSINADRRQWYVVADISDGKINTVYYKGKIQW